MTFFPVEYNPRDAVGGEFLLCSIDTTDGLVRLLVGADGKFTDVNGNDWWGSQLINVGSLPVAIGGEAPEGSITLSFFQDPDADDLIGQVKGSGVSSIAGRNITFYMQPINSLSEQYAPTIAPIQFMQRTMRTLTFSASGAQDRSITVGFEAWTEDRRAARRLALNTEGHAKLTGSANPSLEFMPTTDFTEEKLFG